MLEHGSFDRYDSAILRELEQNGRIGFSALADRVGLSKTPCWNRVQALERSGAIQGYRAVLNPAPLGLGLNAFVQTIIEFGKRSAFEAAVLTHPAILACYTTAGDADYLLHVVSDGVEGLDALLRHELSQLPGVLRCSSIVCLTTIKSQGLLSAAAVGSRRPAAAG
jgi:Lrp/AsnC family transcriptional regulator, leucine-responsive regulatory protein